MNAPDGDQRNPDESVLAKDIANICRDYESTWQPDSVAAILGHIRQFQEPERSLLRRKLVQIDKRMREQQGVDCSPQTYSSVLPANDPWLLELLSDDLTRSLASGDRETMAVASGSTGDIDFSCDDLSLRQFADYVLLDEVGRGGMGVVYRARQISLNRLVALKMIASGEFAGPNEIQRFRTEAEAAAKLDHPGIVPVYEFGESKGRHFFSMALVEGNSLRERIQREGPLSASVAARMVKQMAEAIDYAHEQEIVHRDLKPSNVLMAGDDSPRISDFGLAKQLAALSGSTHSGQILGSPSYMSPEQARGAANVDQRADIYGLGGVLYFILTGRPPFQAASVAQTLRLVCDVDPVMPRSLNPAIPRDLETIVIKCLQKEPGRRYGSARELAADLQSFLSGQPIQARPVSRLERTVMWARRRPGVASLLALLFVAMLAGTTISTYFAVERQMALNESQAEFERAESALDDLRDSIGQFVEVVGTEELLQEERFRPVLKRLLAHALRQYEAYIEEHAGSQDAETRAEIARSLRGIGKIHEFSGDVEESIRAYEESIGLQNELVQAYPANAEYRHVLSDTHLKLGEMLRAMGQSEAAQASFETGLNLLTELVKQVPQEGDYQRDLALSHSALGVLFLRTGRPEEALESGQESIRIFEQLLKAHPDVIDYRSAMATSLGDFSIALLENGKRDEAIGVSQRALQLRKDLATESPETDKYLFELAISRTNYGNLLAATDNEAALAQYGDALELMTSLVEKNPTVTIYRADAARLHNAIGVIYKNQNELERSISKIEAALELQEQLAREHPKVVRYSYDLAGRMSNLGNTYKRLDQPEDALGAFEGALDIFNKLVQQHSDQTDLQISQGGTLLNLGILHRTAFADHDAALDALSQAAEIFGRLRMELPNRPIIPFLLRNVHLEQASTYKADENWPEVASQIGEALSLDDGRDQAMIHADWTHAVAMTGEYATAIRGAETVIERAALASDEPKWELAFKAARALSVAATALAQDAALDESDQQQQHDALVAKAMEIVRKLAAAGHFDDEGRRQELDTHADFAAVREHEDFARLFATAGNGQRN